MTELVASIENLRDKIIQLFKQKVSGQPKQGPMLDESLVELLDDETVGKPSAEGHQMVRGDGTGDCDAHGQHSNFPTLFRDAAIVPALLFHLVLDIT